MKYIIIVLFVLLAITTEAMASCTCHRMGNYTNCYCTNGRYTSCFHWSNGDVTCDEY